MQRVSLVYGLVDLNFFTGSDFSGGGFDTKGIELFEWEGGEEFDAALNLLGDLPEHLLLFFLGACEVGGIWRWPVSDDWLAWPHRAAFFGAVTQSDDKIKFFTLEFTPRFASGIGDIQFVLVSQYFECEWVRG